MIYAIIDTNVLVSALLSRSSDAATVQVVGAIAEGSVCPLYNQEIIAEYEDVLRRPKFGFPPKAIDTILNTVLTIGLYADRVHSSEHFPDADDIVFYEVALSKEDAYLVTGNTKHFPRTSIVVTPAEMVEILRNKQLL